MTTPHGPRVSIGLPVYNGDRYITATLDSLLAQTHGDFELIISDNASTDLTEEICRSYAERDNRILYFRNAANRGSAANYRRVFELASGQYFRWANCDDLFAPESLARCVEILDGEPSVVLTYPKTKLIDKQGRVIDDYDDRLHIVSPKASQRFVEVFERLGLVNAIYGLVRANVLRKTRLIRRFPGGDIPLVAELALYGKFWEIPEFLFYRRFHPGASSSYNERQLQEFYDPNTVGRPSLRSWKTLITNFGSMLRAPVGAREKLVIASYLLRGAVQVRSELSEEVSTGMRYLRRTILSRPWLL